MANRGEGCQLLAGQRNLMSKGISPPTLHDVDCLVIARFRVLHMVGLL
jgi:hypothetical protein